MDDFTLNNLEFDKAKELDKRTLCQVYVSILKRENIILFLFFSWNDYNLVYIKFPRFFFLLSNFLAMNVFFFFDNSINKIYLKKGKYDFGLMFPQIVYSIMICNFTEVIICFLTMSDRYIYKIKNLENNETNKNYVVKTLKSIKSKLNVFFIFIFIIMSFYWYLVTSFCSVYENTQTIYLINFLLSFIIYLIYSLLIYAITSCLRLLGLKNNLKCIYKMSAIIPIF